VPVLVHLPCF